MYLTRTNEAETRRTQADLAKTVLGQGAAQVTETDKTPETGEVWQVPTWPDAFNLQEALDKAYQVAKQHVDDLLAPDEMYVTLNEQDGQVAGTVKRTQDHGEVKTYSGEELLRLYARNVRPKGIVADGAL